MTFTEIDRPTHRPRQFGVLSALSEAIIGTAETGKAVKIEGIKESGLVSYREVCRKRGLRLRSFSENGHRIVWAEPKQEQ